MIGSHCHEIGLLAALASYALDPEFHAYLIIKNLHTTNQTPKSDNGPKLSPNTHRELVSLLSSVCEQNGLTCLHDPKLNWVKLTSGLLETDCTVDTKIKICLEER